MWTKLVATRNYAKIEKCLKSLSQFPGQTIVIDAGNDDTYKIVEKYSASHLPIHWEENWSSIKNTIGSLVEGWSIWIEPWEEIIELPDPPQEPANFNVTLISGEWISYPARVSHSASPLVFTNPVFECAEAELNYGITLIGSGGRSATEVEKILSTWSKQEPANPQVSYYFSMHKLSCGDVSGFRSYAHEYLFRDRKYSDSKTLIKLYLGLVESRINPSVAIGWFAEALADKPWLAEAWFASAEIFRSHGQLGRAMALYKAAIEFGKHRPPEDKMPIDVSKYQEEPEKILEAVYLNGKT